MKSVLLLLILLIPVAGHCYDKHKIKMPVSRWREIRRMKPDSAVIPFTDTLFITFRAKDSFQYHNLNGFIYNGGYTISDDSVLDFGTARFKIVQKRPDRLVLSNDSGIYHLEKDLSDTARIIVLDTSEKLQPVTDIDQMIGHWTVYKRETKEKASGALDNSKTIRSAYITGPSTDGVLGYIFSGTDPGNDPKLASWFIKSYGSSDQTLVCEGKNPKAMKIIKCQKGELILEDGDVRYYLKQFR